MKRALTAVAAAAVLAPLATIAPATAASGATVENYRTGTYSIGVQCADKSWHAIQPASTTVGVCGTAIAFNVPSGAVVYRGYVQGAGSLMWDRQTVGVHTFPTAGYVWVKRTA